MVIGDVISDLIFIWSLVQYKNGWWVFFSFLILYLSLRFTLVFTVTFEKDFFGVEESEGRFGKLLFKVWEMLRDMQDLIGKINPFNLLWEQLYYYLFLVSGILYIILHEFKEIREIGCLSTILIFLILFIIEVIIVPICVIFISPIVLMGHVVKGINGIWKTKSISFYENSFQVQTSIFYATIASLFETITESLPQFLLQSWIYWNNKNNDLIPDSTYYISVGFSLLNILKAIIVFIITRKELIFTIVRLANNIYTEDQICEWNDNALKLKLQCDK